MRDKYTEIGSDVTYYAGIDDLANKTNEEKIEWVRGRFSKIVIDPLEEVRIIGQENQKIWDLNLGVVTLICCGIEALAGFHGYLPPSERPKGYDGDIFIKLIEDFMHDRYKDSSALNNKKYSEILYKRFRCGLAHGLTIEGHEVTTRPEEYIKDANGYISIDLWTLFEDFKSAFRKYLDRVKVDDETQKKFLARFDEIFIQPYLSTHKQGIIQARGSS